MSNPPHSEQSFRAFVPALVLLAISFIINYVDRGNLGFAAPLLQEELHLSFKQLGLLLSIFFYTYTAMQFVMGWLVDRFDVNRILAAGFLLWSLVTAATGLVRGFALLLIMRLILGIGESVAMPAGSKIIAQHLPEHRRGFASGALMSAIRVGNAVGTFGAGYLIARHGWRPVFIGLGLVSLLWLPAWQKWKPADPVTDTHPERVSVSFGEILRHRFFWGTTLGHFASNYLLYFMITWLPSYLVNARHLSMTTMTIIAGVYYSVDAASAMVSGWLQDFYIHRGHTPTLVRKAAMAIAFSLAAVAVLACAVAGPHAYVIWLMAAGVGCGGTGPGLFAFCQRLAGPKAVGRWYGPQNGFANIAGWIAPLLTGIAVDRTHSFLAPFGATTAVLVMGGIAWVFIVGPVEEVQWAARQGKARAQALDVA